MKLNIQPYDFLVPWWYVIRHYSLALIVMLVPMSHANITFLVVYLENIHSKKLWFGHVLKSLLFFPMGENSASAQINLCMMGFKLNRAAYSTPLCFNRFKGYFQYILIHISKTTFYTYFTRL